MTIVTLLIALAAVGFVVAGLRGAVWVPARTVDTTAALKALELPDDPRIFEFGVGDGRNLALIHRQYPGAQYAGIEINPVMWLIARFRVGRFASVSLGDGWRADLSAQNVVITFLMPEFMEKFEKKMLAELKPGSLIISYTFALPNLTPILEQNHYFVYRIDT